MRTNRIAASIVLAAAVLVGTVSPALAQTTTPHFLPALGNCLGYPIQPGTHVRPGNGL